MLHLRLTLALALAALLPGCSSNNNTSKDLGVDKTFADLPPVKKDAPRTEAKRGDLNPATLPKIKSIIPDSGFADKDTPVTLIGENFEQKTIAVYLDGQPFHGSVVVASSASATFIMPKNPYGPPYNPYTIMIKVMVQNAFSNEVKFRYIAAAKASPSLHGVITTKTATAITYLASPPIEGKVTFSNLDAGVSGNPDAEVGYGPVGTNPNVDDKGWHWSPADFKSTDGTYYFYSAILHFPTAGDYDLAYRFSVDGGQYWIFADTDDTDYTYSPAQAAKLKVTPPPYPFYCLGTEDCAAYGLRIICDTPNKICVECLSASDCTGNNTAFGPSCDSKTKSCTCTGDGDCASNPHGAVCNSAADPRPTKYCGCKEDTNCTGVKQCKPMVQDGATTCI